MAPMPRCACFLFIALASLAFNCGGSSDTPSAEGTAGESGSDAQPSGGAGGSDASAEASFDGSTGGSGQDASEASESSAPTYGMVTTIQFDTPFIVDFDKIYDDAYMQQHANAWRTVSFKGHYGTDIQIPPAGTKSQTAAAHVAASGPDSPYVFIKQFSLKGSTMNSVVLLQFASDQLQKGDVKIGVGPDDPAFLIVFDPTATGEISCVHAIGLGTVTVTAVTDPTSADGGKLTLSGKDIELYHPEDSPLGAWFLQSLSSTACPR